jgi:hypothetical protein
MLKGLDKKLSSKGFTILRAYPNVTIPWRPTKTPHNILIIALNISQSK